MLEEFSGEVEAQVQALGKPAARHLRERGPLRGVGEREIEYVAADALHQNARTPVGLSTILTVEGVNNFRDKYAPGIGASISRDVANVMALYAVPMWVHNSAAATGVIHETVMVGLGASVLRGRMVSG